MVVGICVTIDGKTMLANRTSLGMQQQLFNFNIVEVKNTVTIMNCYNDKTGNILQGVALLSMIKKEK
jgi:hypothetical protein